MKRIGILVALLVVTAVGCSSKTTPPAVKREGFLCQVTANVSGAEATGTLRLPGGGVAELTFTSPETVKGLTVTLSGETVSASFGSLSWQGSVEGLPLLSPLVLLAEGLSTTGKATAVEDGWQYGGTARGGRWTLMTDGQGYPTRFSVAGESVTLLLHDFLPLS